jgi:hypothetical protein
MLGRVWPAFSPVHGAFRVSGVGPSLRTGNPGVGQGSHPRLRGFSLFGFSPLGSSPTPRSPMNGAEETAGMASLTRPQGRAYTAARQAP